jgi:hypothetical protein
VARVGVEDEGEGVGARGGGHSGGNTLDHSRTRLGARGVAKE